MKKIKLLFLMQEKVRKGSFPNLVEEYLQKRRKTCHISDASTVTRLDTLQKIVHRNLAITPKVKIKLNSKAKVKENIMLILQMMTMSIREEGLEQILHHLQMKSLYLFQHS